MDILSSLDDPWVSVVSWPSVDTLTQGRGHGHVWASADIPVT